MYELACIYISEAESGGDLIIDALEWMEKAAELDYSEAQFEMASWYKQGGVYEKCSYWLEKAANNGNEKAIKALRQ